MSIPDGIPISSLPSATVPLSGTESVAIVQGGITKKAPASSIGTTFGGVASFSAGTTGFAPSSPTTGAVVLSGVLGQNNGGAGNITGALKGNGAGVVTQAAAADLSNGVTGSGSVVLATSPTLVTPNIGAATGTTLGLTGQLTVNLNGSVPPAPINPGIQISAANGGVATNESVSFGTNSLFLGRRANGTGAIPTALMNNQVIVGYSGNGFDGSVWASIGGIQINAVEDWTTGAHGTQVFIRCATPGTTTVTNAVTVTSTGLNNTAIGATTPSTGAFTTTAVNGAALGSFKLAVAGVVSFTSNDDIVALASNASQTWRLGVGSVVSPGTFYVARNGVSRDLVIDTAGLTSLAAGLSVTGSIVGSSTIRTGSFIVSTLPAGVVADRAYVTDATQTLTAGIGTVVAGTGANGVPVVKDASNWRIG